MSTYVGNTPKYNMAPVLQATGDGTTTAYSLSWTPGTVNSVLVFLSGVQQRPTTDYTVSAQTLTFTAAPDSGLPITIVGLAVSGSSMVPADASVTAAKMYSGAALSGQALIANGAGGADFVTITPAWQLKSGAYTSVNGDRLWCNTTAGTFTIALNTSPVNNESVYIADYLGTFGLNKLTVNPGAGKKIMGQTAGEAMDITTANASIQLVYISATTDWRIV